MEWVWTEDRIEPAEIPPLTPHVALGLGVLFYWEGDRLWSMYSYDYANEWYEYSESGTYARWRDPAVTANARLGFELLQYGRLSLFGEIQAHIQALLKVNSYAGMFLQSEALLSLSYRI